MIILFTILKVLGIIVLIILGLLLCILFYPVRYSVDGSTEEKRALVKVNWLFGIIRFRLSFDGKLDCALHIFRKKLHFSDPEWKREQAERKKKKERKKEQKKQRDRRKKQKKRERQRRKVNLDPGAEKKDSAEKETRQADISAKKEPEIKPDPLVASEKKASGILSLISRLKAVFSSAQSIAQRIRGVLQIVKRANELQLLSIVWPYLQQFLVRIAPRKLQGEVEFGLDDPSTTGLIIGGISMVPFMYQAEMVIYPDFETDKNYFEGWGVIKGRIQLIYVLIFVIQLILKKEIRDFIKYIRK